MNRQFVTTGSQGQQERTNVEGIAERVASAVEKEITKAIEPLVSRIAEVEKKQAKAAGKRIDNKLHEFKPPKADGGDDKPKAERRKDFGYKLPRAED
ncbi:hypothetical protein DY251_07380 [Mesorhizobium denitrificans]|uniref:Uncharacterized protein n=2 Tax=Mesorhizobium denitrificans TaxID=2294114 RepID=A0A371XFT9_9HYPH|nr:hypothetical protein DY251_07380 [Mesorhizobium denitrificans]